MELGLESTWGICITTCDLCEKMFQEKGHLVHVLRLNALETYLIDLTEPTQLCSQNCHSYEGGMSSRDSLSQISTTDAIESMGSFFFLSRQQFRVPFQVFCFFWINVRWVALVEWCCTKRKQLRRVWWLVRRMTLGSSASGLTRPCWRMGFGCGSLYSSLRHACGCYCNQDGHR